MYTNNTCRLMVSPIWNAEGSVYRSRGCRPTRTEGVSKTVDDDIRRKKIAVRRKYYIYWKECVSNGSVKLPAIAGALSISSTAPSGALSGAELLNFGSDTQRKSSSETRTSSSPEDSNGRDKLMRIRRPSSRGKRRTTSNGLIPLDRAHDTTELPSVMDENITGMRLNPPGGQLNKSKNSGAKPVLKPINSSEQATNNANNAVALAQSAHRQMNALSISGLTKPDTNTEEVNGAGWTHTQSSKVPTVTKPPLLTSHPQQQHRNNSNNSNSGGGGPSPPCSNSNSAASLLHKAEANNTLSSLAVTASTISGSINPRRNNKQFTNGQPGSGGVGKLTNYNRKTGQSDAEEPKYADPIAGSAPSFQARLTELASLEAETVRYERLRKLKKKTKDRED